MTLFVDVDLDFLDMESFMPMSVVIVMESYSGVYTVMLRINSKHDKI